LILSTLYYQFSFGVPVLGLGEHLEWGLHLRGVVHPEDVRDLDQRSIGDEIRVAISLRGYFASNLQSTFRFSRAGGDASTSGGARRIVGRGLARPCTGSLWAADPSSSRLQDRDLLRESSKFL